jgi:hypothetical protein
MAGKTIFFSRGANSPTKTKKKMYQRGRFCNFRDKPSSDKLLCFENDKEGITLLNLYEANIKANNLQVLFQQLDETQKENLLNFASEHPNNPFYFLLYSALPPDELERSKDDIKNDPINYIKTIYSLFSKNILDIIFNPDQQLSQTEKQTLISKFFKINDFYKGNQTFFDQISTKDELEAAYQKLEGKTILASTARNLRWNNDVEDEEKAKYFKKLEDGKQNLEISEISITSYLNGEHLKKLLERKIHISRVFLVELDEIGKAPSKNAPPMLFSIQSSSQSGENTYILNLQEYFGKGERKIANVTLDESNNAIVTIKDKEQKYACCFTADVSVTKKDTLEVGDIYKPVAGDSAMYNVSKILYKYMIPTISNFELSDLYIIYVVCQRTEEFRLQQFLKSYKFVSKTPDAAGAGAGAAAGTPVSLASLSGEPDEYKAALQNKKIKFKIHKDILKEDDGQNTLTTSQIFTKSPEDDNESKIIYASLNNAYISNGKMYITLKYDIPVKKNDIEIPYTYPVNAIKDSQVYKSAEIVPDGEAAVLGGTTKKRRERRRRRRYTRRY